MEHIPLPSSVSIVSGKSENSATVTIEPCYPGYGMTIGNAIRRVLLSSLPGAAITAFSVKGLQHEFSALPNVKEDFVEIALNIKQIRLQVHTPEPVRIRLSVKGERRVTAGDIETSSDVEILNKDLILATLTDKAATLEMEFIARQGRGYETTDAREKEELEVGMIAVDSLFSPIQRVGFQVEHVRVGQMTNWDKLVLDIETDGTILPREAVNTAVQYLLEQFGSVASQVASLGTEGSLAETDVQKSVETPVNQLANESVPLETPVETDQTATKTNKRKSKKASTATS